MAASAINQIKGNLALLFDRPTEPVFMPKGPNKVAFDLPSNLLPDRFKNIIAEVTSRFGDDITTRVAVKNITLPDISLPMRLGRYEQFSLFNPLHARMASRLINIFMEPTTLEDLQSVAAYCREALNPYLFNYAFSVALLHRPDTREIAIPSIAEVFPDKYLESSVFARARENAAVLPDGSRNPILIARDNTGTDLDPEHRVAYFREDLGINLHHWHWHLVYPFASDNRQIVAKDRRGELFYYMHQQIVARYDCERLANQLNRVGRLNNFKLPIPEGYFPKLDSTVAGRAWTPRFANIQLSNINRAADGITILISNLEQQIATFRSAIAQGYVVDANQRRIQLTEETGIDILGNMMEASPLLSPNYDLYGNVHNEGHTLISYVHDPDGRYMENMAVMGDSATAMRDPVFYRWHAYVNDIFVEHKSRLPRYTVNQLSFPEVKVTKVQVDVEGGQTNALQTFWEQSDLNMSRGLDFAPRVPVFVRITHLQNRPFTYRIQVSNSSKNQVSGYVRIFMAPRLNSQGREMSFEEQRHLMIELDKFRVGLKQGQNEIVRRSDESSVTISYERTFRSLNASDPTNAEEDQRFTTCGCGWPQHMLIPRGTAQGMQMDLFVMVSNYANDRVNQDMNGICSDADSYCGILNRSYPDKRSMGYPFDRIARDGVSSLSNFLTPNMAVQRVSIVHRNETTVRGSNTSAPTTNNRRPTNNANTNRIPDRPISNATTIDDLPVWN